MVGMILLATFGEPFGFGMIHAAALGAGLMLLTRCCSASQARASVDWQVLVVIASGFALGSGAGGDGGGGCDRVAADHAGGGEPVGDAGRWCT
jgi:hypothetical protein